MAAHQLCKVNYIINSTKHQKYNSYYVPGPCMYKTRVHVGMTLIIMIIIINRLLWPSIYIKKKTEVRKSKVRDRTPLG